jgi:hypothetical protein
VFPCTERIKFLEAEIKSERQALRAMTLARDSLQDDMAHMRAAKKQSDEVSQQQQLAAAAAAAANALGQAAAVLPQLHSESVSLR